MSQQSPTDSSHPIPIEERIGEILIAKKLTMATAESCTGGRIAHLITSIPGSSTYFLGGVVSYSNQVKEEVLGVSEDNLRQWGAVSEPVVEQMVKGVKKLLHVDCAVATSGIAGPGGGTPDKPVGTVWIAVICNEKLKTSLYHLSGNRLDIINQSSEIALRMLYELLCDY